MAPECVQVKIEIGHKSVCRTALTKEGFTHDWVIFVRGAEGSNISHFVDRVVFYLHESFPKPRRVIKDPPYKVAESGYGSFLLPVEIYFRNKDEPKKVRFEYDLYLQLVGNPPVNNVRVEALTFSDPVEDFKKKLLKAGGVVVPSAGLSNSVSSPPALPPAPPVTKAEAPSNISTTSEQISGAVKKPKSSPSVPPQTPPPPSAAKSKPKESSVLHGTSLSVKRPSNLDDNSGTPKVKKKKVDRSEENAAKPVPKEISILSPQLNSSEKDKSKTKMTLPGLKKGKEAKERKKSFDAPSTTPSGKSKIVTNGAVKEPSSRESPGRELKSREAKLEKLKKDKSQKKLLSQSPSSKPKDELPKVQKLTVKRKSGDAWASSSAPGFNLLTSGKNSKKDTKLDELIAEFANESSSDDEDGDTSPPFIKKDIDRHLPLTNGDLHKEEDVSNSILTETKLNTAKTKKSSKGKTIATLKSISSHNNNNINKVNSVKKSDNPSPQNGKTRDRGMSLKDLYDRICSIEDAVLLQKVVDIVESTGLFEVTDTTFDFDLCRLDSDTISKLEESVLIAA